MFEDEWNKERKVDTSEDFTTGRELYETLQDD